MNINFEEGDRVQGRHYECFGLVGNVIGIIGEGRRAKIRVDFVGNGIKDCLPQHIWKIGAGEEPRELSSSESEASSSDDESVVSQDIDENENVEEIENNDVDEENEPPEPR